MNKLYKINNDKQQGEQSMEKCFDIRYEFDVQIIQTIYGHCSDIQQKEKSKKE